MSAPQYTLLSSEELARLRIDMHVGGLNPPTADGTHTTFHVGTDCALWQGPQTLADALEHVVTEVVVNCADQVALGRSKRAEFYIDKATGLVRVWNEGRIPVEKHPQRSDLYNAEVIYGLMNSSSNYNDAEKEKNNQFTGGRNGIGAKAANILSKRFTVTCIDAEIGLELTATWREGMTVADGAVVKPLRPKRKTSSVCVEFIPDYTRLGCPVPLPDAAVQALAMRFVECAATSPMKGARFMMDLPLMSTPSEFATGEFRALCVMPVEAGKRGLTSSTAAAGPSRKKAKAVDGDTPPPVGPEEAGIVAPGTAPSRRTLECQVGFKALATSLLGASPDQMFHDSTGKVTMGGLPQTLFEVAVTPDSKGGSGSYGYVNSVRCHLGTHINYAKACIASALLADPLVKKTLGKSVSASSVNRHFRVGVRCLIPNPSFASQTKEKLVTPASKFGFSWSVPPSIIKKLREVVVEEAKAAQDAKETRAAVRTIKAGAGGGRDFVQVPKLDDAILASFPSKRGSCSLYVTEGDSAKAFAVAGLSVIGRERNGVMPIRGKLRNVRDLSTKTIMECQEVVHVLKALGLAPGQNVTDLKQLRYQKFVILTDQDDDGHHITGLLANMIDVVAPGLLDRFPQFISRFVTPLVKATKQGRVETFFDDTSFREWSTSGGGGSGWSIRFLKGLGSSSAAEAKEYFRNLEQHLCPMTFASPSARGALEIAFGKDVPKRKAWMLETANPPPCDYAGNRPLPFDTFCNTSLAAYSQSSLSRGIPSAIDGFCEATRKLLYGLRSLGVTSSERVSQLVGKLIGASAYHHGDASLTETLVRMAQDYVGGMNVALLVPDGQFGSRIDEKKKHASARYIATLMNPVVNAIFRPEDDALLVHNTDDGKRVEPTFFLPTTCYCLFNETAGICTGWSTTIPAYNPRDVIRMTMALINGQDPTEGAALKPWYRGYTGHMEDAGGGKWAMHSTMTRTEKGTVRVTELPPGRWTDPTIEALQGRLKKMTDGSQTNTHVTNRGTDRMVDLEFRDPLPGTGLDELERKLGLVEVLSTSNMHLFDTDGNLKRYSTAEEIVCDFVGFRMPFYEKRRSHIIREVGEKRDSLSNRAVVIAAIADGRLPLSMDGKPRAECDIVTDATALLGSTSSEPSAGADWVMDIRLKQQTKEEVRRLDAKIAQLTGELMRLQNTTAKQMWLGDLDDLLNALDVYERAL